MSVNCRICSNPHNNKLHTAREMMFGTRDEFEYLECGQCGTVQIVEIPDLSRYYPEEYYSFGQSNEIEIDKDAIRRLAARMIADHYLTGSNFVGKYLAKKRPWFARHFPEYLKDVPGGLGFRSKILDFGCGSGHLLSTLRVFGFRDLTGADAFIESDIIYPNGVRIFKKALKDLEPSFDLIMLNHSFEHLPDPFETLAELHRLQAPNGIVLIRIPLVSFAWEKYGVNWVQLDPPRHIFLYSEPSFRRIAADAGFEVLKVVYDSEAFQFFGSEQYLMDIPMNDPRSFRGADETSIFSEKQFEEWTKQAEVLNQEGRGDQACFYLRKR